MTFTDSPLHACCVTLDLYTQNSHKSKKAPNASGHAQRLNCKIMDLPGEVNSDLVWNDASETSP